MVLLLNKQQEPESGSERWEQAKLDDLGRWADDLRAKDGDNFFLPQAIEVAIVEITNLRRELAKLRAWSARVSS